ncbi:MAG: ABC transporter permease subunit [Pirellulaceae bacterium]|nr:ABC transporter permease subunit [Pirellulaceae bacterium]
MNRSLLKKSIREALPLLIACVLALFAFSWIRVWVTGLFEFTEVQELLQRFRRFERFSPIPFDQLASYEGRIGMNFDEPIVLLCVVIWSIARGSDIISGELSRGTMEMLLSQPIRRAELLRTQILVAVGGLLLMVTAHWLGMTCGIYTVWVTEAVGPVPVNLPLLGALGLPQATPETVQVVLSSRVSPFQFLPATLNLFLFGFLVFGLATMISCFDSFRWRTIGLTVGIHVFHVVLLGLSQATDRLKFLAWFTYCNAYQPQKLILLTAKTNRENWRSNWLQPDGSWLVAGLLFLLCAGITCLLVGLWRLNRRDLDPPF